LDEYERARERYAEALLIYEAIGARLGQADAIRGLGDVHLGLSEFEQARARYQSAISIYTEIGTRYEKALVLSSLGTVCLGEHDYTSALALYRDAELSFHALGVSDRPGRWVKQEMLADLRARLAEQPDLPGLKELLDALEAWRG
jgi:tetratricopeptide (TPR) repeat protein